MVVNKDSATLGLSPERERQIGLDSDHSQMCKISHAGEDFLIISQALMWLFLKALRRSFPGKALLKQNTSPEPGLMERLTKPSSLPPCPPTDSLMKPGSTKAVAFSPPPRLSIEESDTQTAPKLEHRKSSPSSSRVTAAPDHLPDVKLHSSFGAWLESFRPNESACDDVTNKEKGKTKAKANDAVNEPRTTNRRITQTVAEAALPWSEHLASNEPLTNTQAETSSRTQYSSARDKHAENANHSIAGLAQLPTIPGLSLPQQERVTKKAIWTTSQRQTPNLTKTTLPPQKHIAKDILSTVFDKKGNNRQRQPSPANDTRLGADRSNNLGANSQDFPDELPELRVPIDPGDTEICLQVWNSREASGAGSRRTSRIIRAGLKTRVDKIMELLRDGSPDIEGLYCLQTDTARGPCVHRSVPVRVWITEQPSCYSVDDGLEVNIDESIDSFNKNLNWTSLSVTVEGNALRINGCSRKYDGGLDIHFIRTLRLPDDGKGYSLPGGFGPFPILNTVQFLDKLPETMVSKGGIFFPMLQREALWMSFQNYGHLDDSPFAIRVLVGGVNAITGKPDKPLGPKYCRSEEQDYIVAPKQKWLDGIRTTNEMVRQFVAMPVGSGYSVEKQITGNDYIGGFQMEIIPRRANQLPELEKVEVFASSGKNRVSRQLDRTKGPRELKLGVGDVISLRITAEFPPYKPYESISLRDKDMPYLVEPNNAEYRASIIRDFLTSSVTSGTRIELQEIHRKVRLLIQATIIGDNYEKKYDFTIPLTIVASPFADFGSVEVGIEKTLEVELKKHGFVAKYHWSSIRVKVLSLRAEGIPLHGNGGQLFDQGYRTNGKFEVRACISFFYYDIRSASCGCRNNHGEKPITRVPGAAMPAMATTGHPSGPGWDMGIAPGGNIKQHIVKDLYPEQWDWMEARLVNIQILNSVAFESVTGMQPPASPISAEDYVAAGIPMFHYQEETTLSLESTITTLSSVAAIDSEVGTKVELWGGETKPTICLSCGMKLSTVMYVQTILDLYIMLTSGRLSPCYHSCCHTCFHKMKKLDSKCDRCSKTIYSFIQFAACMGMPRQEAWDGELLQSVNILKLDVSREE